MPVVLVLALLLGHAGRHHSSPGAAATGALPAVTVPAPPPNPGADTPCTAVIGHLPLTLAGLAARPARSTWPYVVAWGNPAIVLRCGVPRPPGLVPGSDAFTAGIDGVFYWVDHEKSDTVFIAIDRAVYIEVTVPTQYAGGPLAPISDAITKALPAVCVVDPNETDLSKLCTHRR
ncbi:MAG TPA: DUF3515 domain-containing protein [Jatrophihabitantaceae bacterium]